MRACKASVALEKECGRREWLFSTPSQATTDLLVDGRGLTPVTIAVRRPFLATKLQVSTRSLFFPASGPARWTAAAIGPMLSQDSAM